MRQLLLILLFFGTCSAQTSGKEYTIKEFGWTIRIPDGFEKISGAEWEKVQDKGADIVSEHLDEDVSKAVEINQTFFVVNSGQHNVLEVSKQPYDKADGDPEELNRMVGEIMSEALKKQLPGTIVTTKLSTEEIGGKTFYKTTLNAKYPNGMQFIGYMYSRIFGNTEFCINIMYIDPIMGRKMLDAVKASTFNK